MKRSAIAMPFSLPVPSEYFFPDPDLAEMSQLKSLTSAALPDCCILILTRCQRTTVNRSDGILRYAIVRKMSRLCISSRPRRNR